MTWAINVQGARLVVREGDATPRQVALERRPMTLGRAPDNNIVIGAEFVAAHHARIEPFGAGHRIVDLGGACGIMFGGAARSASPAPRSITSTPRAIRSRFFWGIVASR